MKCRFCDQSRRPPYRADRPAPETCGAHRCRGRLLMARHGEAHRARSAEHGRKGGRTSHIKRWASLLEKWMNASPREALRMAYREGYHAGWQAGVAEKKGKAA